MKHLILIFISVFAACPKTEYSPLNQISVFSAMQLPYDYKDLEPVLWSQVTFIHYKKEYAKFLVPLNEIISSNPLYQSLSITDLLIKYGLNDNDLAINAGGYYNHGLYWWSLVPTQCSKKTPEGALLQDIQKYFGSFEDFKSEFTRRAVSLFGSGWIWLCMDPSGNLRINGKQYEYSPLGGNEALPIFGIDMWEHAYYLYYMDDVQDWINGWWGILDWSLIEYWYQEYILNSKPIPI